MYKLISQSDISTDDIVDVVLKNRGITDKDKFLNPSKDDVIHYSNLKNMNKLVEVFKKVAQKEQAKVVVIVDMDLDGFTSSSELISYIEINFPNIEVQYLIHPEKAHGITKYMMNKIKEIHENSSIDLLIVPDAGSNDYEEHKALHEMGIVVGVLDHHEVENGESKYAIVVNPQLSPEYENKQISGVGVVYKFLQALDDEFGLINADDYLDLVSWGNISDSMQLSSPETRYLVYEGLKNIQNEFFREMIMKHIGNMNDVYPHSLSFSVTPKINAMIRIGKQDEKEDLFKALLGREEDFLNTRTGRTETLPEKVTRLCTNAHSRQNKTKKKWLEIIREQIYEEGIDNNAFLLIEIKETPKNKFERSLTGVIAQAIVQEFKKPTLIMVEDEEDSEYLRGSLRGYENVVDDAKSFLLDLELFEKVSGHANASGFRVKKELIDEINKKINSKLTFDKDEKKLVEVDFEIDEYDLGSELVEDVYQYEHLWSSVGCSSPKFATTITVNTSKFFKSKSSNMIKVWYRGIDFVQFEGDRAILEHLEEDKIIVLSVVGTMGMNNFAGKTSPQFIIDCLEIKEIREAEEEKEDDGFDLFDW